MEFTKKELERLMWLLNMLGTCEGGMRGMHNDLVYKKIHSALQKMEK
jgi:hypothetical protein|tara:strand:- start:44 stop:184 length:141 start_codon:yes stop_codon:yes gene_type:complete